MDALFHFGELYFDVFSLGMIVFLIIYAVAGAIRGFVPTVISLVKVSVVLLGAIFLCIPVGTLISKTVIHSSISGSINNFLVGKNAVFAEIVPEVGQAEFVQSALTSLGLPDFLVKALYGVVSSFIISEPGQPLGNYVANSFTTLIDNAIAFITLVILITVIVVLFCHFIKSNVEAIHFGVFDRILGASLFFFIGFMILEGFFFAVTLLTPINLPFMDFINKTFYLKDDNVKTFSKWMIQNNLFAVWFNFKP